MNERVATGIAGLLGFLLGYLGWLLLWEAFVEQVSYATLEAVRQSEAFTTIAGVAAAGMSLAPAFLFYAAATALVRWWNRRTAQ